MLAADIEQIFIVLMRFPTCSTNISLDVCKFLIEKKNKSLFWKSLNENYFDKSR